jgi:hypothetical protein
MMYFLKRQKKKLTHVGLVHQQHASAFKTKKVLARGLPA